MGKKRSRDVDQDVEMSNPAVEKRDGDESSDDDEVRWQPYTTDIYIYIYIFTLGPVLEGPRHTNTSFFVLMYRIWTLSM